MTPAGIEPATFRFTAQHLNHCANAVPTEYVYIKKCFETQLKFLKLGVHKLPKLHATVHKFSTKR